MQLWSVDALGGFMYSLNLSNVLRYAVQPMVQFRQFADVKDAAMQGKKKGEIFHWNVYKDVETEGRQLSETEEMPKTNFQITQGSLTITEYGNSVPFSEKLDNLSEHSVKEVINKVIRFDTTKVLDKAAYNQFNATNLTVTPTGGNSATAVTVEVGGPTITNNIALNTAHVKAIVDEAKERNIPAYNGGDYIFLGRPRTFRTLKNELEDVHKYVDEGFRMILNGEIGRYESTRFVEQTNIASEGWTNAKSDGAFFFGDDTVAEAIAVPEEIRGKIPTDYGRSRGIAWYYLGGFGIVHNETDAVQNRIIKWDSAA